MSFLQTLHNRQKLLRWLEEGNFRRRVDVFVATHASAFAGWSEAGEYQHACMELHRQFCDLFEAHLQMFLDREGLNESDFIVFTKRFVRNLSGADGQEWDSFLDQLTSCLDFNHFASIMHRAALSGATNLHLAAVQPCEGATEEAPRCSVAGDCANAACRQMPEAIAMVFSCVQDVEFQSTLQAFVSRYAPSFFVKSKEHRHEWYTMHLEYGGLFEACLEQALKRVGITENDFAAFLEGQAKMEETSELRLFLETMVPAEDYLSFWRMMTDAAHTARAPAVSSSQAPLMSGTPAMVRSGCDADVVVVDRMQADAASGQAQISGSWVAQSKLDIGAGQNGNYAIANAQSISEATSFQPPQRVAEKQTGWTESLAAPEHLQSTQRIRSAFSAFLEAPDAQETQAAFQELLTCAGLQLQTSSGESLGFHELNAVIRPELDRRLAGILQCLEQKLAERGVRKPHGRYQATPLLGVHCAVCGAGPVGLRAAVELRMLGATVSVFEQRVSFSRLNRLKLWEWVKFDLFALGTRQLLPKFGAGAGHLHIGIRQLQLILWKVCLLLGVNVHLGVQLFEDEGRTLRARSGGENAEAEAVLCDVLLEAGGPNNCAWPSAGLEFAVMGTAEAIGMVANFERRPGLGEELKEFSWARQFNQELFRRLEEELQANLENIVYLRGEEAHYFVMTPRRRGLVACGVLEEGGGFQVNKDVLRAHVTNIAAFFGIPADCGFAAEPQLFDFSKRKSCRTAMQILAAQSHSPILAAVVGDALLEPFWPEGLGITRGFLGALDTAWELSSLSAETMQAMRFGDHAPACAARATLEATCRSREKTFKILKQIGAANQSQYLLSDERAFSLDPYSRYKSHLL